MKQLNFYQLILLGILFLTFKCDTVDLSKVSKNGLVLSEQTCNAQTIINFAFSSSTILKGCAGGTACTTDSPSKSGIQFLNFAGDTVNYPLTSASMQTGDLTTSPRGTGSFRFNFGKDGKQIIVIVPYRKTLAVATQKSFQLKVEEVTDPGFSGLKGIVNQAGTSGGLALSAFNFLNLIDYGLFYHVTEDLKATQTVLLSHWVLILPTLTTTNQFGTAYTLATIPAAIYPKTAQKLCYGGSNVGIFQTKMRQSYVLWASWFAILFYWLYVLLAQPTSMDCYDKNFDNNRWTCWGFYSLHYLAHEQYFTVLSRTSILLVNFSWQALCLACIYSNLGTTSNSTIVIWASIIALFASMPVPYILGYVFMSRIYQETLHKFDVMKKLKNVFNKKEGVQAYEKDIDDTEERLYGLYYWFYVFVFIAFFVCWVVGIHQLQMLPRQYFYMTKLWLASLGITFALDNLIFDPLLAFLLGNTSFYRIRGFYYDFRLGQRFKEVQQ